MNEDLMILRGRYVTLESELTALTNDFKAFARVTKNLQLDIEAFNPDFSHNRIAEQLSESASAIKNMIELQKKIAFTKSEIERIRPMTGL
jgi:predicted  nucleic acid-binding Zn-ribbon protein